MTAKIPQVSKIPCSHGCWQYSTTTTHKGQEGRVIQYVATIISKMVLTLVTQQCNISTLSTCQVKHRDIPEYNEARLQATSTTKVDQRGRIRRKHNKRVNFPSTILHQQEWYFPGASPASDKNIFQLMICRHKTPKPVQAKYWNCIIEWHQSNYLPN